MSVLAIILALLVILVFVPIKVVTEYEGSMKVRLKVLSFERTLFPRKKTPPKPQSEKKSGNEGENEKKSPAADNSSIVDKITQVLDMALELLGSLRKAVRRLVKAESIEADIRVGTDDAAKTAVSVGALWGIGYNLVSLTDMLIRVEKHSLNFVPDYSGEAFECRVSCILRTNIANIICAGAILGIAYIRYILKTKLRRKNYERASVK